MANHAHSTRTPLLPQAGAPSALLPRGVGRQLGPVTLALRAMRTAEPVSPADAAIQAIRDGLSGYFADVDRRQLRDLRASIAGRIAADLALLDTIDGRRA